MRRQDRREISGRVVSGRGEGSRFTELEWFRGQLGFIPYPGTLNLEVRGRGWEALRRTLAREKGIPIVPPEGFCAAKCFRVVVNDTLEGAAVFPEVPNYPPDKLEIVAPHPVRERLGLRDGDRVRVRVLADESSA
ncbi:MAG: DUF120 domain-containing protein [Candidatus Methylomirabilia bacterium]